MNFGIALGSNLGDRAENMRRGIELLLERVPGCYANIGNGPSAPLHNPAYDFNDEAMPHGVRYFVELARSRLPLNPRP